MIKRVVRPGVRQGYDRWAETYDKTPNPVVALDRRHTPTILNARRDERILDAGCGTGGHLGWLLQAGSRPVGVDFSGGMLRVAQQAAPGVLLLRADLNRPLPLKRGLFDAVLCSLVSEHLTRLDIFFTEAFRVLRAGGRLVFSAFHPSMAGAGVEANFEQGETEFRLGAERHTLDDFLRALNGAGFEQVRCRELAVDEALARKAPAARKYEGRALMVVIEARRVDEAQVIHSG